MREVCDNNLVWFLAGADPLKVQDIRRLRVWDFVYALEQKLKAK